MTTKQQLVLKLAKEKNLTTVEARHTKTIFVEIETGVIGIHADGNKHDVWFNPKGWGSIAKMPMREVLAIVGA